MGSPDCDMEPEGMGSPDCGVDPGCEFCVVERSEMALVSSVDVPVLPCAAWSCWS